MAPVDDEFALLRVALVAASLLLAGCGSPGTSPADPSTAAAASPEQVDQAGLPQGSVSEDFVRGRTEAQLTYPGAEVVWPFWSEETSNFPDPGRSAAFAGAVLASPDSADQIYAWYEQWLTQHGWARARFLRAMGQPSVQGYARGRREVFSVAMDEPHAIEHTIGHPVPPGRTIFEYRYMIEPVS